MRLEALRARWVATAGRDMRSSGNREAYRRAYTAYYRALGARLGWQLDRASGYYRAPDGRLPGINDMEEALRESSRGGN